MIAITTYEDRVYMEDIAGEVFKGFIHKTNVAEHLFDTLD
jgi:hypothetical protein